MRMQALNKTTKNIFTRSLQHIVNIKMNLSIQLLSSISLGILLLFGSCKHPTEPEIINYHNRILFHSSRDGGIPQIFMMNPDGSDVRQLTKGPYSNMYPTWSWDARKIVFSSSEGLYNGGNDLFIMNSDGSGRTSLPVSASSGLFSPDGKKIVFDCVPDGEAGGINNIIFLMNSDGTDLMRLSPDVAYRLTENVTGWSLDGTSILFSSNINHPDSSYHDIYNLLISTHEVKRLTISDKSSIGGAQFSPDGTKIAFTSNVVVKTMNIDGSNAKTVIEGFGFRAWSPDGKEMLISNFLNDHWENFIINIDGSGFRQILTNDNTALATDWSK